ncbi:hypothetical protein BKA67DRAFT_568491 [Truncatella angustata]|uniref:Uncharacterized protein n=1 Tax=Truncatella angustata TaxID=152316 RepID=A0A9P8ZXK5_9PEZI|nr:uncharacterized protein BKA67DRAFT_568491 [Truncatella angustata]KAH6653074.1 hypothetical protein BKA67DRAFT_568491 [Truncatella angustata]
MPPKRKPAAQKSANAQEKRRKSSDNESSDDARTSESPQKYTPQPYEYVVVQRPMFDVENENNDKDEEDQLDEDSLDEKYAELTNAENVMKPASEFPGHKWIAMAEAWKLSIDYHRRATYTCPDFFDMYIYNDFCSYGVIECIENLIMSLHELLKKKQDEESLKKTWALSAALIHWIVAEQLGPWLGAEDGERVQATCNLIGRSILATLNELDLAGLLKADSSIKDLSLIISLYIYWSDDLGDMGIEESEDLKWRVELLAYAKKAKLDLEAAGVYGIGEKIESLEEEYDEIAPLAGAAKADRWGWKQAFSAHAKDYGKGGKLGGENFNIMRMSKKERKEYNFDGKDPLAEFSQEDLRSGKLMIG